MSWRMLNSDPGEGGGPPTLKRVQHYVRTCMHACMHACMHTHMHTCVCARSTQLLDNTTLTFCSRPALVRIEAAILLSAMSVPLIYLELTGSTSKPPKHATNPARLRNINYNKLTEAFVHPNSTISSNLAVYSLNIAILQAHYLVLLWRPLSSSPTQISKVRQVGTPGGRR